MSVLLTLAREAGREAHHEGFPDRAYTDAGHLVPRDRPGAVLDDAAAIAERAVELALSGQVASVCVHGDHPGAVRNAAAVRQALEGAGLTVRCFA